MSLKKQFFFSKEAFLDSSSRHHSSGPRLELIKYPIKKIIEMFTTRVVVPHSLTISKKLHIWIKFFSFWEAYMKQVQSLTHSRSTSFILLHLSTWIHRSQFHRPRPHPTCQSMRSADHRSWAHQCLLALAEIPPWSLISYCLCQTG